MFGENIANYLDNHYEQLPELITALEKAIDNAPSADAKSWAVAAYNLMLNIKEAENCNYLREEDIY